MLFFFFFKQKTAYEMRISDWSSDVCSSDLPKAIVITELNVQIKRRADATVIWEGRAITEAKENAPAAQPGMAAAKLAGALFKDFPGVSGRTITVKCLSRSPAPSMAALFASSLFLATAPNWPS